MREFLADFLLEPLKITGRKFRRFRRRTPIKPEVPDWLYKASDLTLLFAGLVGGVGGAASKLGALVD